MNTLFPRFSGSDEIKNRPTYTPIYMRDKETPYRKKYDNEEQNRKCLELLDEAFDALHYVLENWYRRCHRHPDEALLLRPERCATA